MNGIRITKTFNIELTEKGKLKFESTCVLDVFCIVYTKSKQKRNYSCDKIHSFIAGPPYEPNDFHIVMETSISVTVRWKAGFAAGYGPQTFRLEYKANAKPESGKIVFLMELTLVPDRALYP